MLKSHFKSNTIFSNPKSLNVDKENGIVKNVVIVQQGANKNGSYFNNKFILDLAQKGNEQNQGVKSRFGHPNMCSTSLGTFLGRYKNFNVKDNKVFADLHIDPITKETEVEGKGIKMFDYVIQMAESNPDMFGNSIHISSELFEEDVDGKKFESHILESLIASDLVDDPAATDQLFNSYGDLGIAITQFLDENPQVFKVVNNDPSIIQDFFDRYADYAKKFKTKIDMTIFEKIQKKFSTKKTFDVEETTATGEIITVVTEDSTPKVGDKVVNADGNALADGNITIKDGSVWVIAGGAISEMKPKEEEVTEEEEEPTLAEVMQSVNNFSKKFDTLEKLFKDSKEESDSAMELIADEVGKFNTRLTTLAKGVKSKEFDNPPAEPTGKGKGKETLYDRIKSKVEEKEKEKSKK